MADLKIKHVTHAKSNKIMEDGKAKLPTAEMLEYGEIAINYAKGVEKITIKNAENEIVTFSSDEQIKSMVQSAQGIVTDIVVGEDEQYLDVVKGELDEETNTVTYTVSTKNINIPTKVSELENDKSYITASEVPSTDLTGYAKESWVENKGYLTEVPEGYITETELEGKGYLTEIPEEYLKEIPSEYVTETELEAKGYLTAIPDEYVTETELEAKGYATVEYVDNLKKEVIDNELVTASALTELKETKVDIDELEDYVTKTELKVNGYLTEIPSEYVTETELEAKGYLTAIPEEYLKEIPSEYVTETELEAKGYLTEIPENYVTNEALDKKGYLTEIPSEYITERELEAKGFLYKVVLTQEEYDALEEQDPHALYIISDAYETDGLNFVTETQLDKRGFLTNSDKTELVGAINALKDNTIGDVVEGKTVVEMITAVSDIAENMTASLVKYEHKNQTPSIPQINGTNVQEVLTQLIAMLSTETKVVKLTQSEYDALETYNENALYVIINDIIPQ